jgi:hypothetical protein
VSREEVFREFPHPLLLVTAGLQTTGYLDGWGSAGGEVNAVDLSWGDRFDEARVRTRTHSFEVGSIGLDEIAGNVFGPLWEEARDGPPSGRRSPPARAEERWQHMRRSRARAIGRSRRGQAALALGGASVDAYVIEHGKAFGAAFLTPAGGFATVAGRGVALDALGLSLSRDTSTMALEAPEWWADA